MEVSTDCQLREAEGEGFGDLGHHRCRRRDVVLVDQRHLGDDLNGLAGGGESQREVDGAALASLDPQRGLGHPQALELRRHGVRPGCEKTEAVLPLGIGPGVVGALLAPERHAGAGERLPVRACDRSLDGPGQGAVG